MKAMLPVFTPREAEIATCPNYKPESLETVFERANKLIGSVEELAAMLDGIEKKGGIETKMKGGRKHYCNAPLVVGMYEFQASRLTPEFVRDFDEYVSDMKFGIEFLATELPQMRTIPIGKSITPQNHVGTFDRVLSLLEKSEGPFAIERRVELQRLDPALVNLFLGTGDGGGPGEYLSAAPEFGQGNGSAAGTRVLISVAREHGSSSPRGFVIH
ncbi:MAG: hypothetical protein ACP5SH_13320 [Syntrophobacteraceae bacterium]